MEILIIIGLASVAIFGYFVLRGGADKNHDGKVDIQDVKATAEEVKNTVVEAAKPLDVNQDGKVDVADVKEVVKRGRKKASEATKKVATKAKTVAAKTRGRRPASTKA